ncbi:PREDICTED: sterile alpha motif domain-containing protein 9-like [Cyprinodon variegatus]|uniref:sterile alpha motif domain-containing protein 9-like n=1 Tax=Cyprinodon variegatus TaxID=28743 RepID=UPI0007427334|nr:PREDICTED: sterile alpha motif domain-containing protein 9-like [Cyprinodon variegatus]
MRIVHARDELINFKRVEPTCSRNQSTGEPTKPYPFGRYHDAFRYLKDNILAVPESGSFNFIEPCHEFKGFYNTPEDKKMEKFITEVIRFAAACMNSRTNGTIHFGIGDKPEFVHGQVLGVAVDDKEAYAKSLKEAIDGYFEHKHKDDAQKCIKPPRFVEVLNKNTTLSYEYVIEVDIEPQFSICGEKTYKTYTIKKAKKMTNETKSKQLKVFYIRDGGSSRDLFAPTTSSKPMVEYNKFVDGIPQLSKLRKDAEEKHSEAIKSSTQGSKLMHMITGGTLSLDKSNYERYLVVTNKSHSSHLKNLDFLTELKPVAVLDFDPESNEHGLLSYYEQNNTVSPHLPAKYEVMGSVKETAVKLELPNNTSWVFCNGGIEGEKPSDIKQWSIEKGASVHKVISFLCRRDVLPHKRFLVIFLLLSTVSEKMDPLIETFNMLLQELKAMDQILCICDNENAFTSWKDLISARCGEDISDRCIYELSFAEVNGTIRSLWSENRRAIRFLPCGGGIKVPLMKKSERSLKFLEVLCVNQCEGGNEDRAAIEEDFYRGGNVSWWNFYFSEQPGLTAFIKRDKFDYIVDTIIPDLCSLTKACVLLNLIHLPGCGGTTLAKHVLWALRDRFRCAVLKKKSNFAYVAEQVVQLLMYAYDEQTPRIPVLLMIDDFDDMENVNDLQQAIENECIEKDIQSAKVILLNCMRSNSFEVTETTPTTVFIGNRLSDKELKLFEVKLREIEKEHQNFETFYGFMIMKENFNPEYIKGVVQKTLKNFNMEKKNAQLFAVLVLLKVYCNVSSISLSLCMDFLDHPKPVCGGVRIDDIFQEYSSFISSCLDQDIVVYKAVKITYSIIAKQCLEEIRNTHNVTTAKIANFLLTTDQLYEHTQGRDNLVKDVHDILVKRFPSFDEDSRFSPLIQQVAGETPGQEEIVLENATKRFDNDAIVCQLLARYYYLKKKDFSVAKEWAKKAMAFSKDSYMANTAAQVIKHQLKSEISECKEDPISPEKLLSSLKLAQSAMVAFRETQDLAKRESFERLQIKRNNCPFNTSGCLGEIQVGVFVIHLLQKTVFSSDGIPHDIMSQFLSGNISLSEMERSDPWGIKYREYYDILREFENMLCNLKERMKWNFDYLDRNYVNLGTVIGIKNPREKARQFLEKEKADTFSGILDCLTKEITTEEIEEIVRQHNFICLPQHQPKRIERINMIYANVVLGCIKPESDVLLYQDPLNVLSELLCEKHTEEEYFSLLFIAVVLLWLSPEHELCIQLETYISQLKVSYFEQMKEVINGKYPIVHFLLGSKSSCRRLVQIKAIQSCVTGSEEHFASLWGNGQIFRKQEVRKLLQRFTGQVRGKKKIMVDTCFQDQKLEVIPLFQSQISGLEHGSKVSFFIGFSMKGPLALDIERF